MASTLIKQFKPVLRYPGGKQKALNIIKPYLPHKVREFREPMVGGGTVFFWMRSIDAAQRYWINDVYHELIVFYTVMADKERNAAVRTALYKKRKSGVEYARLVYDHGERVSGDNLQLAGWFFLNNRCAFSGGQQHGFSPSAWLDRFTPDSIAALQRLPEAFENTTITDLDYEEVLATKGDDVFLFLDPPYISNDATALYKHGDFDHAWLAKLLRKTKHKFLLTLDDCDEARKLFKGFEMREVSLRYPSTNCRAKKEHREGSELFILNY